MNGNSDKSSNRMCEKGRQFTRERLTMQKPAIYKLPQRYPDLEGTLPLSPENKVRWYRTTSGFTKINPLLAGTTIL